MEIKINKDIRKYKTKDIGNFSFKEAGFIVLGVGLAYITYKFTNDINIAIAPMLLVLVVGFFKPYGMSFIQFLRTVVKDNLTPQTYYFETDNVYCPEKIKTLYEESVQIDSELWVIQTQNSVDNKVKTAQALLIQSMASNRVKVRAFGYRSKALIHTQIKTK